MRWPWLRRSRDIDEAEAALERARRLDEQVSSLGRTLADLQRANHFSQMVQVAISQAREA